MHFPLPASGSTLPNGEPAPHIVVEYLVGSRVAWRRALSHVEDDLETRYVRAARAKMEFALVVPGKGGPARCAASALPCHGAVAGHRIGTGVAYSRIYSCSQICGVPGSCGAGTVEAVLWYFPYENGAETVPRESGAAAYGSGGGGGGAGGGILTHLAHELPTQLSLHGAAALATQVRRLSPARDICCPTGCRHHNLLHHLGSPAS